MASSDHVNYAIRPNKAVERRIVFDVLDALSPVLRWPTYRYIGLGAPWFVDFVMAHRVLLISDMVSIEKDSILASRAEFNKPYACVTVEEGDSSSVLDTLELDASPVLVWLDYDTGPDGPVLDDLATLCGQVTAGSVIIVTVNAHRDRLPTHDEQGRRCTRTADGLRAWAGDLVPVEVPRTAEQRSGYPRFLASVLISHMHRQVRVSGRQGEALLPLFNIGYADNAPMITVGGVIATRSQRKSIESALDSELSDDVPDAKRHLVVRVPPLTVKEKAGLDQLLPRDTVPHPEEVEGIGFRLRPSQIEAYCRFYRHYPTFVEVSV